MKQVAGIYTASRPYWVGDGLPVRLMFSHQSHVEQLSPFLLLGYTGPCMFTSGNEKRGVGEHPHRGLRTVTIVYSGKAEYCDSTGRDGIIGLGDVQWMTAGAGILHEEFRLPEFTRQGGELEMVQPWVNLPAEDETVVPGCQGTNGDTTPIVVLPDEVGSVCVIASSYQNTKGPTHAFSPLNVWDMHVQRSYQLTLSRPEGWSTALVVLRGDITVNGIASANEVQLMVLSQQGKMLHIEVSSDASMLLLFGEPLNEPVVGYDPFVMSTKQEIVEAVRGFSSGRSDQT